MATSRLRGTVLSYYYEEHIYEVLSMRGVLSMSLRPSCNLGHYGDHHCCDNYELVPMAQVLLLSLVSKRLYYVSLF